MIPAEALGPLVRGGLAAMAVLTLGAVPARAQMERNVPSARYLAAFSVFYDGEYRDAVKIFQDEGRGSIKTPQSRWIDSICYETMCGECYYQMGMLQQALEHYTAAVKLYVAFSDWMLRVQFPPNIRASATGRQIPWGGSTSGARLGQYPETVLISQGRINNNEVIKQGGVVQQPLYYPINVQEIVRSTTLAIRRRGELLGPLGEHDPLTADLIAALLRRPCPPNHWSEAWVNVQLGLAYIAGGKPTQGILFLERSRVAAGEFAHPFTSIALLELGKVALQLGEYPKAAKYLEEATYFAVYYPDPGVLEEAFRYGTINHLVSGQRGVYPPLATAAEWARRQQIRQPEVSLLLDAAENYASLGQVREAAEALARAKDRIGVRAMGRGYVGARLNYLAALVAFQQGRIPEGDAALSAAMTYMKQGSHRLLHISLADGFFAGNDLRTASRTSMDLFTKVLSDPQPIDWLLDPMETLAVLDTPHVPAYEHWFMVALEGRKEHENALQISDCARRHAFFSTLGYGGRLQSLRWLLDGPVELLDQQAQLQRRDLLARYPRYGQLSQQVAQLRNRLKAVPLVAANQEALKAQGKDLAAMAAASLLQEAILREIAVRREPASLVFPPLRTADDIQKSLPEKHAILAFFATRQQMYGFLMNNKRYTYWPVQSPAALTQKLVSMLRDMGHFQPNHELAVKDLAESKWREPAQQVLDLLLKGSQADFTQPFEELIVVPHGVTWYVPFEALQLPVDGHLEPLLSRCRIRYVPTVSLATTRWRKENPVGNTAVVCGLLYPRVDPTAAQEAFARLAAAVPGAVALASPAPAPSAVYASLFDRLIVLDDLNMTDKLPYGWAPDPIDANKPGNTLNDWMALPWAGPSEIILPGFHTAAESSLKDLNVITGEEIFLPVCGLMSSGARTILLSRWRTGGGTSYNLVKDFAQELPHTAPADAWQRAVFVTAGSSLDLDAEPRIKRATTDVSLRADHPFFWAGYMLIDSGLPVEKAGAVPVGPVPLQPPAVQPQPGAPAAPGGQPPARKPQPPGLGPRK